MKEQPPCSRVAGCNTPGRCTERQTCLASWRKQRKRDDRLFGKGKRIRDDKAIRRKLLRDRTCRGCGKDAGEGHHIVFRSQGGDDVEDNIAPLCSFCHTVMHDSTKPGERDIIRETIGKHLQPEEVDYVLDRLGEDEGAAYLRRFYKLDVTPDAPAWSARQERASRREASS